MTKLIIDDRIVEATPERVAKLFAEMDDSAQARFFNHVAKVASKWEGVGWPMQLQAITDNHLLTLAGRRVMQSIGEYSHWGLVPQAPESNVPDDEGD